MKNQEVKIESGAAFRKKFRKAIFWSFWLAWSTSRRLCCALAGCFLLNALIPVASTATLALLIGELKDINPGEAASFQRLLFWLGLSIGLFAVGFLAGEIQGFARKRLGDESGLRIQTRLYSHASRMDLAFYEESESLNQIFRANISGTGSALGAIQSTMMGTAAILQILGFFGLMFYLQPIPATLLFVGFIPMLVIRRYNAHRKYRVDLRVTPQRRLGRYYTGRLAGEEAAVNTKMLGLSGVMISRFDESARSIIEERRRLLRRNAVWSAVSMLLYMLIFFGVIVWSAYRLGWGEITVTALAAFCIAAFRVRGSISQLLDATTTGMESTLSLIPLMEFLEIEPAISDKGGLTPDACRGEIALEDVSFTYPHSDVRILDEISLKILSGESVAIVGRNGAGKTTLTRILARIYEGPTEVHRMVIARRTLKQYA